MSSDKAHHQPLLFDSLHMESPFWNHEKKGIDYNSLSKEFQLTRDRIKKITGLKQNSIRFDQKMPEKVKDLLLCVHTIFGMVFSHFKDFEKTKLWFEIPNPMLGGGLSPRDMIYVGRHKKLLQVVKATKEGERP